MKTKSTSRKKTNILCFPLCEGLTAATIIDVDIEWWSRDLLFKSFSAVGVKKVLETGTDGSCITELIYCALKNGKNFIFHVSNPVFKIDMIMNPYILQVLLKDPQGKTLELLTPC